MSESFLFQLMLIIAAIVMFAVALKLSYRLVGLNRVSQYLASVFSRSDSDDFGRDPYDRMDSFNRMNNYCNYFIGLGAVLLLITYSLYVFHLFSQVPVNPIN